MRHTKVINFFNLKGGSGKTTLTSNVANGLIWEDILSRQVDGNNSPSRIDDPLKIAVLDIDTQNSINKLREKELTILQEAMAAETNGQIETLEATKRQFFRRYAFLGNVYGWYPFEAKAVEIKAEKVEKVILEIESNEYDYIFMDFPGSYDQDFTGDLLAYTNFLFIPLDTLSVLEVADAKGFISDISAFSFHNLIQTAFVSNKYRPLSQKKHQNIQEGLTRETGVDFLTSCVHYSDRLKGELMSTVFPCTARVNLNTYQVTPNPSMASIGNLSREILQLTQYTNR